MSLALSVDKTANEQQAYKNVVLLSKADYEKLFSDNTKKVSYVRLSFGNLKRYAFVAEVNPSQKAGTCMLSLVQRKFCNCVVGDKVSVEKFVVNAQNSSFISKLNLQIDFLKTASKEKSVEVDTEKLSDAFVSKFANFPFEIDQPFAFNLNSQSFLLTVQSVDSSNTDILTDKKNNQLQLEKDTFSILLSNSKVVFVSKNSSLLLLGANREFSSDSASNTTLINTDYDFTQLGVGGLDHQFSVIFRRAFSSRIFPPEIVAELGLKHVRGILLFGPPGTGKTLLARQIGKMLNSREPKIVNGPEILNKFVGESEANVRKLFEDAEKEQQECGHNSKLHLIIFDEIDAICKQRGKGSGGGTNVHDTVVNQLLSKIDGVNQLNNILLIGMTNRKDLIDQALLRPGRFEIQLEIGLPDKAGRVQILKIHTSRLERSKKLNGDVDLGSIAEITKNFSGAELEGVVRAATTAAMNRLVNFKDGKVQSEAKTPTDYDSFCVKQSDLVAAATYDIHPAFGHHLDTEKLLKEHIGNGIVDYSSKVNEVKEKLVLALEQVKSGTLISPTTLLLVGEQGAGKTALAVWLALNSQFPFIKMFSPEDTLGMGELEKCQKLASVFDDCNKSDFSVLVIDDVERIIEYAAIGPRFSNTILQTLLVLIKKRPHSSMDSDGKKKKLLILLTGNNELLLDKLDVTSSITMKIRVDSLTEWSELYHVIKHYKFDRLFKIDSFEQFEQAYKMYYVNQFKSKGLVNIGIKKFLAILEMSTQNTDEQGVVQERFRTLLHDYVL